MPLGKLEKGREQTTLIFDTWADVGSGELVVHWPCDLSDEEMALLSRLAAGLGYLGRSESWVEAELASDTDVIRLDTNAFPHHEGMHSRPGFEQISLMAAIPSNQYGAWHRQEIETALADFPLPEGGKRPTAKLLRERNQATAPYPPDLFACLTKDTAWWKRFGWSQPPGSQRVLYWRRSNALEVGVPRLAKTAQRATVTTMVLSLTTPSGNRSALPRRWRTLPQAELLHRAVVGRVARGGRIDCSELTGKDSSGNPLRNHHEHAHTIPVDLDGDGRLDHIIIHAPMGLGDSAQHAIRTLKRTWTKGGVGEIQVSMVGAGDIEILRKLSSTFDSSVRELLGPPEGSRIWESTTPFVFPRFLKPRGRNSLLGQINAELASRQFPAVANVEVLETVTRALRHFVRRRTYGGGTPPVDEAYGLRLTFAEPIRGPLLLGYASHYGLGRFRSLV